MEAIKEVLSSIGDFLAALKINPMYILLWVAAGYIQGIYLHNVSKLNAQWKTLILGSVFSVIYAILLRPIMNKGTWVEFTASYVFATSMYELFIKDIVNMIIEKARKLFTSKLQ